MNKALVLVVAAIALATAAYFFGTSNQKNADQARKTEAVEASIERHDQAEGAGQKSSQRAAARRTRTEAVFNGIRTKEISYAQAHPALLCGLDPDGLRLWSDANAGADAEPAGLGDGGVPAAAATGEWPAERSADESHRGSEAVSPVPGSAPGADRLAGGDD